MKKNPRIISVVIFIGAFLYSSILVAQVSSSTWSLAGNNNATGSSKLGTSNLVPLKFFTNNSQRMVIDSLGKVGIGITKPVNIFTVKSGGGTPASSWLTGLNSPIFMGFAETVSSEHVLATASNTPTSRSVFHGRRSRGTLAAPAVVANNDYLTSLLASGYDGSTYQNPAGISIFVDGVPSAGNVPARISLVTGSNLGNRLERLKVGSTGNFDFNNGQIYLQKSSGNVGIGTATPTYPLDLRGNSSTTQIRLNYPSNGGPYFASIGFSDPNQGLLNICSRMDMGFENLSGNSNSYIAFRTGQSGFAGNNDISTERMRITSSGNVNISGNVGIGTIDPGNSKLKISYYSATQSDPNYASQGFAIVNTSKFQSEWGLYVDDVYGFLNLRYLNTFLGHFETGSGTYYAISDERLKINIKPMETLLGKISQLKPSTYQFKNSSNKKEAYGFIAQDVVKLFPGLVTHTLKPDVYTMDYSGFGVLAIKGIQELQPIIEEQKKINEEQKEEIETLKDRINKLEAALGKLTANNNGNISSSITNATLEQNIPNPFTRNTTIGYNLPADFTSAQIKITDKNGRILKTINISGSGKGTLNVDAAILSSGAYNYSLFVNGRLVGTKQMERLK